MPAPTQKILVLRGGALGDFLLTLPALAQLRRLHPGCHLTLIGNATAAQLALPSGVLDEVHSQHAARWAALYGQGPLPEDLAQWLATFDLVVSFWPDPDRDLQARFPVRAGQRFICGAAKPLSAPAARHFCEALTPLGIEVPPSFHFPLSQHALPPTERDPKLISLHPGSSSKARNWPADKWRSLAFELQARGAELLLITGEADEEQARALGDLKARHVHALPLPDLAALLARSAFHLGHDTGISHLASALDIPSLILFGPSDPQIWAPQGSTSDSVKTLAAGDALCSLTTGAVLETLRQHPCKPAFLFSQTYA